MNSLSVKSLSVPHIDPPPKPIKAASKKAPPIAIKIELWLEICNGQGSPAAAYFDLEDQSSNTQSIIIVFQRDVWPTSTALTQGDSNALRWIAAITFMELLENHFERSNLILRALKSHLVRITLGDDWKYKYHLAWIWTACGLANHELFASIDRLSILRDSNKDVREKFAEFNVEIDSAKLATWRAKRRELDDRALG